LEPAHHRARAILLVLGAILIPTVIVVAVIPQGGGLDTSAPVLSNPPRADRIPQPIPETAEDPVVHLNSVGDYQFTYPPSWVVDEVESLTQVESPSGAIVVSFWLGSRGDIATASDRLVSSILDAEGSDLPANRELIGTRWERIDGSRSLIVSGTTTDAGRSTRFLAITVRSVPRNYSISVLVPARSDPTRVLPMIEAIVSSFEILEPQPEVLI
jgi:hypothetical protein